jgi:hypothetical protein
VRLIVVVELERPAGLSSSSALSRELFRRLSEAIESSFSTRRFGPYLNLTTS